MYQKVVTGRGNIIVMQREGLRLSFLEDEGNSDYQAFLAWVAEGNEPEVIEG